MVTQHAAGAGAIRRVLVIKLGALGDFIHAFHAFAAIRAHHPDAMVTLLTTAPFAGIARCSPWFDEVLIDPRAPWWKLVALRRIARALKGFDRVYDLQTSRRSNRYFHLAGCPSWSGIASGCEFPHANPQRNLMHTVERQREQLRMAGISSFPVPQRDWFIGMGAVPTLPSPFALLVPGSSKARGCPKRWPLAGYVELARLLASRGITPAVAGGRAEAPLAAEIRRLCSAAIDLTGRTSIPDLAAVAAGAALVVGNDTGPVHIAASVGAPVIALFSANSIYEQAAPRGPAGEWATTLSAPDLADLTTDRVAASVLEVLGRSIGGRLPAGDRKAVSQKQEEPAANRQ